MRRSRTVAMGRMGAPLITGGAAPVVLSYDPHWCGQEVCGPPPGATAPVTPGAPPAARPPRVIALHFAGTHPATPPAPTAVPIPTTVTVPSPVSQPSPGDLEPPLPPPPAPSSCSCSWWPAILFALAGFGGAYVAQNKSKKRKAA